MPESAAVFGQAASFELKQVFVGISQQALAPVATGHEFAQSLSVLHFGMHALAGASLALPLLVLLPPLVDSGSPGGVSPFSSSDDGEAADEHASTTNIPPVANA